MKVFILISDGGDGSYSTRFVLDENIISVMHDADNRGELKYPSPGVDGDGFHYTTIIVPDGSTSESLGLSKYSIITEFNGEEE